MDVIEEILVGSFVATNDAKVVCIGKDDELFVLEIIAFVRVLKEVSEDGVEGLETVLVMIMDLKFP